MKYIKPEIEIFVVKGNGIMAGSTPGTSDGDADPDKDQLSKFGEVDFGFDED